jgi:hypothetical protein
MTAIFMVRLPIEALYEETATALAVPYLLDIKATKTHWINTWRLEESENYDRFGMEDGRSWMTRLAPVRDELLRGDLRSLYIGWLAAVAREMMDDGEIEPLTVRGLGSLTAAQQALAEFLEVDPDLLAGAGMGSAAAPEEGISRQEMDEWIDSLPRDEVNSVLQQLLEGKGQQAERSIKNRFAAWLRGLNTDRAEASRRTVGELRQNAGKARQIRLEKQKRDQKRREIQRREQREAYLKKLSNDFPKAWASVREPVERGSGRGYDEACCDLVDIAEAYALNATEKAFQKELKEFHGRSHAAQGADSTFGEGRHLEGSIKDEHANPKKGKELDALDELIEEITIDAYGDDEQLWAFRQAFEDEVELPAEGFVIGEPV